MLTKELLEVSRSPRELSEFVVSYIAEATLDKTERHSAFLKEGYYKVFIDELVPLSIFAGEYYPQNDVDINLVIGNQSYDAIVKQDGVEVEKIEISSPHDGARSAEEFRQVVKNSFSNVSSYTPGEDLEKLRPIIISTCRKKSTKDYPDCLLVISIDYLSPFEGHEDLYRTKIHSICEDISGISFNAKKVFLLEARQKRLHEI